MRDDLPEVGSTWLMLDGTVYTIKKYVSDKKMNQVIVSIPNQEDHSWCYPEIGWYLQDINISSSLLKELL